MKRVIIQTELGPEQVCTCCKEPYPQHKDFFYRNGIDQAGNIKYVAQCKDCYKNNYNVKQPKKRL